MRYRKKRIIYALILLLLLFFTACNSENQTEVKILNAEAENEDSFNEKFQEQKDALEKFKAILLEDGNFVSTDLDGQNLSIEDMWRVVTTDDSIAVNAVNFAVIDLDSDGQSEVVLGIQAGGDPYYGFEVLQYRDEAVYGYTLPYRAFMNVKTDGTFHFSSGAADSGAGRLFLSETGYTIKEQVCSQSEYNSDNELTVQYYIDEMSCSEEEFHNAMDQQDQKMDIKWYDFSTEAITTAFSR